MTPKKTALWMASMQRDGKKDNVEISQQTAKAIRRPKKVVFEEKQRNDAGAIRGRNERKTGIEM